MAHASLRWLTISISIATSLQQAHDPINDLCRRFGQQTAVVDDRLYIDGGLIDWNPIAQNPANYSSTSFSAHMFEFASE